jgi:hypothetical protein
VRGRPQLDSSLVSRLTRGGRVLPLVDSEAIICVIVVLEADQIEHRKAFVRQGIRVVREHEPDCTKTLSDGFSPVISPPAVPAETVSGRSAAA